MVPRGGTDDRTNASTRRGPRVGVGAILVATLIGASLGVGVHVLWPEVGAAGSVYAPTAEVAGARVRRDGGSTEAQVEALGSGVVLVEASGCGEDRQASATFVRSAGGDLLLTNAHVVRGSGTVSVRAADGSRRSAAVLGAIVGRDAAVLRLDDPDAPLTAMATGDLPSSGDPVAVLGYPAAEATVRVGRVGSIERRSAYGAAADVLVVDTPTGDGQSGGAVLDASGLAVGLVAARDPGTGDTVAYPIDSLLQGSLGPVPTC